MRLDLADSLDNALYKLSEGNPGALSVLMEILKRGWEIDPYIANPWFHLNTFDTFELYGESIWLLYKYVCKQDLSKTIALVRAVQLGIISLFSLKEAIAEVGPGLNVEGACAKVKERLPNFQLEPQHAA